MTIVLVITLVSLIAVFYEGSPVSAALCKIYG